MFQKSLSLSALVLALLGFAGNPGQQLHAKSFRPGNRLAPAPQVNRFTPGMNPQFFNPAFNGFTPNLNPGFITPGFNGFNPNLNPGFITPGFNGFNPNLNPRFINPGFNGFTPGFASPFIDPRFTDIRLLDLRFRGF